MEVVSQIHGQAARAAEEETGGIGKKVQVQSRWFCQSAIHLADLFPSFDKGWLHCDAFLASVNNTCVPIGLMRCGSKNLKKSQVYPRKYGRVVGKFHLKHMVVG